MDSANRTIRIGAGAGWWRDRIDPAESLARDGALDFLCFETMAEATVSYAQTRRRADPAFGGYDTLHEERMRRVLGHCVANGTRIITNGGWIDPLAAARATVDIARELGLPGLRVAAVQHDDLTERICDLADEVLETGAPLEPLRGRLVSAEAYAGIQGIVQALADGAHVVITGRVADPALFLAPMVHTWGWAPDDITRLARGAGIGHLLECAAQVTGGYFSDPGFKDVPEPWNLGMPIAEVDAHGNAVITKLPGTGGCVDLRTVKEQMFYEVHDPSRYLTPDASVNFLTARLEQVGADRVRVSGISGSARPERLKVSLAVPEGYIGEDWFFYAGPGALARARLAERILHERFRLVGLQADDLRIDLLGVNAVHREASAQAACEPYEVGVRVAARTATRAMAEKVGREVDGMAVSGIASTGKRVPFGERVREVVGIYSTLVERGAVSHDVRFLES